MVGTPKTIAEDKEARSMRLTALICFLLPRVSTISSTNSFRNFRNAAFSGQNTKVDLTREPRSAAPKNQFFDWGTRHYESVRSQFSP